MSAKCQDHQKRAYLEVDQRLLRFWQSRCHSEPCPLPCFSRRRLEESGGHPTVDRQKKGWHLEDSSRLKFGYLFFLLGGHDRSHAQRSCQEDQGEGFTTGDLSF